MTVTHRAVPSRALERKTPPAFFMRRDALAAKAATRSRPRSHHHTARSARRVARALALDLARGRAKTKTFLWTIRSEERRVGKECRRRWGRYDSKVARAAQ